MFLMWSNAFQYKRVSVNTISVNFLNFQGVFLAKFGHFNSNWTNQCSEYQSESYAFQSATKVGKSWYWSLPHHPASFPRSLSPRPAAMQCSFFSTIININLEPSPPPSPFATIARSNQTLTIAVRGPSLSMVNIFLKNVHPRTFPQKSVVTYSNILYAATYVGEHIHVIVVQQPLMLQIESCRCILE